MTSRLPYSSRRCSSWCATPAPGFCCPATTAPSSWSVGTAQSWGATSPSPWRPRRRWQWPSTRTGRSSWLPAWASGCRAAWASWDQPTCALFAQVAHRMTPPLGGTSVLRESIPLPEDIGRASRALVDAMGLDGVAEVEFRRDAAGRPLLMEINPRLSASVLVAVRSGVDLPTMLWRWAAGEPVQQVPSYRTGVRVRWLGGG